MKLKISYLHLLFLITSCLAFSAHADTASNKPVHEYAIDLYGATDIRIAAREWMLQRGKTDVVPALIRSLRYFPEDSRQTLHVLKELTGQELGPRWFDWMVWLQANPIKPFEQNEIYIEAVFNRIDPNFKVFFNPGIERHIKLDEIVWGGVRKDGIPALTEPTHITPEQATYLTKDELVFGVSINGDTRAYPYRIMDWHEMFNDTVGGVSVSLAYCTLCGSGILYKTNIKQSKAPLIFGSSGFLYRSNKLMYDQSTHSLWNQFSGKPVVGPLTQSGIELEVLPVVTTTWGEWLKQHPDTKVLSLDTGYTRDYTPGAPYGAYFFSEELMFPAFVDDQTLQQKDKVFGLRISGSNKAWPLKLFKNSKVIHDQIGIIPIVLIGDEASSTVRAYRSEGNIFTLNKGKLISENKEWQLTENELIGPNGERLSRLPGHVAYWFAWSGYFPDTLATKK